MRIFSRTSLATGTALALALGAPTAAYAQATYSFNLPAQDLGQSLRAVARRTGENIVFDPASVRGRRAAALNGSYSAGQAVERLLAGTGLEARRTSGGSWVVSLRSGEAQAGGAAANSGSVDVAQTGVAEILVVGSRSQNVDIRRSEDDAQPYVVFSSEQIARSNATSLDDFLRTRLPMNAQSIDRSQRPGAGGSYGTENAGEINLRGIGTNQTLVLVDGRRTAGIGGFTVQQGNISGIPLAAIERIEVLPSTAGAIYGGSAVGGVVNIIRKRNYRGLDVQVDYGNTFDNAREEVRISLNGGFSINSTQFSLNASRSQTSDLRTVDRNNLTRRSEELRQANNPSAADQYFPVLGATPNICGAFTISLPTGLFGICDGTPLTLDNGTPLNASITSVPAGYAGPVATGDGGAALLANAGRYNLDLPNGPSSLIRGFTTEALGLNIRHSFARNVEGYVDAGWDRIRYEYEDTLIQRDFFSALAADDPNNPFQQDIMVSFALPSVFGTGQNEVQNYRLTGGLIFRLAHQWSLAIEQSWSKSYSVGTYLTNPLGEEQFRNLLAFGTRDINSFPPTLTNLRSNPDSTYGPLRTYLWNTNLRASGPVFTLPAGPVMLTALAERRSEEVGETIQYSGFSFLPEPRFTVLPDQSQTINSIYAEARIPIFSAANSVPLVEELDLQFSIRHDRYAIRGAADFFDGPTLEEAQAQAAGYTLTSSHTNSTSYLVALRYKPAPDLLFRASWSTGFLPPSLDQVKSQINEVNAADFSFNFDPRRGNSPLIGDANGRLQAIGGGNGDLRPERSVSWSLGAILTPRFVSGLRLSIDYTRIKKSGEITSPGAQFFIDNEDLFPGRIVRGPNLPTDAAGWAGPIVGLNYSLINSFRSDIEAIDYQIDYTVSDESVGEFHFYAIATQSLDLRRQVTSDFTLTQFRGFADGPLKWRGNFGLDWRRGPLRFGWNVQYYSGYQGYRALSSPTTIEDFVLNQGGTRIPSQTYHDFNFGYAFDRGGPLGGFEISGGVQNVFNTIPPVINSNYGTYSTFGDPRLRRFTLSIRRHF